MPGKALRVEADILQDFCQLLRTDALRDLPPETELTEIPAALAEKRLDAFGCGECVRSPLWEYARSAARGLADPGSGLAARECSGHRVCNGAVWKIAEVFASRIACLRESK